MQLTKARKEILDKQFKQAGGQVLTLDDVKKELKNVDYIITSKKGQTLEKQKLFKDLTQKQQIQLLESAQVLQPDFISDSLKQQKIVEFQPYILQVSDQELKQEQIRLKKTNMNEIIQEIQQQKGKKRKLEEIEEDKTEKSELKSKYYYKGQEIESEESYLHKWKPDFLQEKEEYWDKQKEKFLSQKSKEKISLNQQIIQEVDRLYKYYQNMGDKGRMFGYRKALQSLRSYDQPIYNVEQLDKVPYLGQKIKDKIQEFINTGTIQRFEFLKNDEQMQAVDTLCGVWGIGPAAALNWYKKGVKTIDQLRKRQKDLTSMQKIGLKYYEDLLEKIPREEVGKLLEEVKKVANKIVGQKMLNIEAVGSYRRGREMCGDIDVLITRDDGKKIDGLLEKIVIQLEEEGFLKERLGSLRYSQDGNEGYMGICQLTKNHRFRRIDIKAYPKEQYAFALLYFTGSGNFNRSMRLFANKKGYSLSDHGIVPILKDKKGKKGHKFKEVPCFTEEEIFKFLHMDFKTPQERDV